MTELRCEIRRHGGASCPSRSLCGRGVIVIGVSVSWVRVTLDKLCDVLKRQRLSQKSVGTANTNPLYREKGVACNNMLVTNSLARQPTLDQHVRKAPKPNTSLIPPPISVTLLLTHASTHALDLRGDAGFPLCVNSSAPPLTLLVSTRCTWAVINTTGWRRNDSC